MEPFTAHYTDPREGKVWCGCWAQRWGGGCCHWGKPCCWSPASLRLATPIHCESLNASVCWMQPSQLLLLVSPSLSASVNWTGSIHSELHNSTPSFIWTITGEALQAGLKIAREATSVLWFLLIWPGKGGEQLNRSQEWIPLTETHWNKCTKDLLRFPFSVSVTCRVLKHLHLFFSILKQTKWVNGCSDFKSWSEEFIFVFIQPKKDVVVFDWTHQTQWKMQSNDLLLILPLKSSC